MNLVETCIFQMKVDSRKVPLDVNLFSFDSIAESIVCLSNSTADILES